MYQVIKLFEGGRAQIRITFIITRADDLGGAQVHLRDLALALSERGEEVFLLAGGGGILFDQLAESKVVCRKLKHLVYPIKPVKDLLAAGEIRGILKTIEPDLVSTHSNKAGLLGRFAARSLNVPVVHTTHGFLFSGREQSASGRFYRLAEKIASSAGTKVIAVSKSEYEEALRLKIVAENKITFIHNGLPELDQPLLASPGTGPVRLVMVARFAEPKDHLTLFNALSELKQHPWKLDLIGDGAERCRMEKLVVELDIAERVKFLGACSDVASLLSTCSMFVLSSKREGFPLSILEAMRVGLPVIAADVGGVREAVVDEQTGFLFPAGDINTLNKCLTKLIQDPDLRREMGRAGRKRFLDLFTHDRMVDHTLQVYRESIKKQGF